MKYQFDKKKYSMDNILAKKILSFWLYRCCVGVFGGIVRHFLRT